jgi:hypothetical protein
MPRWIPRIFLCLFFYTTSVWAVGRIAAGVAYLFARGGSLDLWQFLHGHPFARALVVGLLAGIIPLQAWLAASGLMDRKIQAYLWRLKLDRLKPWIVVFCSPILLLALFVWIIRWFENRSLHSSVLFAASPYPFSDFLGGFMSTDCSDAGNWGAMFWGDSISCMIHVQLISAWLLTAGYSLAPFVRKRVLALLSGENPESFDREPAENIQESKMTEKTEINENSN